MQKVMQRQSIRINEPVVVFPLREWERIKDELEEREEAERFRTAFEESRGKKFVSLEEIKRKYNLK